MKLQKIRKIEGKIRVLTGLHIGASSETIEIGGMDNPIIKDPLPDSGAPYIPGSSLKGKMRSLMEIKEGRYDNKGGPCQCGARDCPVCPVFGTAANTRPENLVTVGMPVTRHPPYRSVREELPHTAPTSGNNA